MWGSTIFVFHSLWRFSPRCFFISNWSRGFGTFWAFFVLWLDGIGIWPGDDGEIYSGALCDGSTLHSKAYCDGEIYSSVMVTIELGVMILATSTEVIMKERWHGVDKVILDYNGEW